MEWVTCENIPYFVKFLTWAHKECHLSQFPDKICVVMKYLYPGLSINNNVLLHDLQQVLRSTSLKKLKTSVSMYILYLSLNSSKTFFITSEETMTYDNNNLWDTVLWVSTNNSAEYCIKRLIWKSLKNDLSFNYFVYWIFGSQTSEFKSRVSKSVRKKILFQTFLDLL